MIATKRRIHRVLRVFRAASKEVPSALVNAYKQNVVGGRLPLLIAADRVVFIPKSNTVDDWDRVVRSLDASDL